MSVTRQEVLRKIPSVDQILLWPRVQELNKEYSHSFLVKAIRETLNQLREEIIGRDERELEGIRLDNDFFLDEIESRLVSQKQPSLKAAINATGIVLHTNLGRAPLSGEALEQILNVGKGYSTLEIDVRTGERGSRYQHVESLLCQLTGAEGAMVVNNNAAAVLLALGTLAKGKEVIISRGQLVEIGGSFRVPEVMEQSGAKLVEVGATNKTYLQDYERAINDQTGLLLLVHTSNYRILGFTAEVELPELVELGKKHNLPVLDDLGSGVLLDLGEFNLGDEPTVANRIKTGVDVVTFSGDKLLGGPQAGIIVGKAQYIQAMKKHPLTRALRIDKFSLAALEATLRAYLEPEKALKELPLWQMLSLPLPELEKKAKKLAQGLRKVVGSLGTVTIEKGFSKAGGGSLPLQEFPTCLVIFGPEEGKVEDWAAKLRRNNPPIFTRISKDKIILDPRTLGKNDYSAIYQAFKTFGGEQK